MKKRDRKFIGGTMSAMMEMQFGKYVLKLLAENPGKEIVCKIEIRDPIKKEIP